MKYTHTDRPILVRACGQQDKIPLLKDAQVLISGNRECYLMCKRVCEDVINLQILRWGYHPGFIK